MGNIIRLGMVGAGMIAGSHLRALTELRREGIEFSIEALCDLEIERAISWAEPDLKDNQRTDVAVGARVYDNADEMLAKEKLDAVIVAIPTYRHAFMTKKCLDAGCNVLCEKPMALSVDECREMIDAANKNGKKLMIGQTTRFKESTRILRGYLETRELGKLLSMRMYKSGSTPLWSPWFLDEEKSGGCITDLHVHDTDLVVSLFGVPKAVSTIAGNRYPGSGFDFGSTHYIFEDGVLIHEEFDWSLRKNIPNVGLVWRANFEKASIVFTGNETIIKRDDDSKAYSYPDIHGPMFHELKYFIDCVRENKPLSYCLPETSMHGIAVITAEKVSAKNNGAITPVVI